MAASDLKVSPIGTAGNVLTVSVYNPQSHSETARIRATVTLVSGASQVITSSAFTVGADASTSVQLLASGAIASLAEGPDPVDP